MRVIGDSKGEIILHRPAPLRAPRRAVVLAAILAVLGGMTQADARVRVVEKAANLDIALRVREALREEGIRVSMTRTADRTLHPSRRIRPANRRRVDAFVSIHNNASRSRRVAGTEVYRSIRRDGSAQLGTAIWRGFRDEFGAGRRNVVRTRRGCCGDYYYQLRRTRMASVLVEAAYLSNPAEGRALGTSARYRQRLADAVADGIIAWQARLGRRAPDLDPGITAPAPLPPATELQTRSVRAYRVELSWRTSSLADGYRIYRDGTLIAIKQAAPTEPADLDGRGARFADRWASPGQSYTYVIRPFRMLGDDIVGEGAPAILEARTPPIHVMLDAGHGGRDPGAVRRW